MSRQASAMPDRLISLDTFYRLGLRAAYDEAVNRKRAQARTVKTNNIRGTPITNDTSLQLAPPRLKKRHQLDRMLMIGRLSNPTVVYSFGTASPPPPQSPLKCKKQQHVDGK